MKWLSVVSVLSVGWLCAGEAPTGFLAFYKNRARSNVLHKKHLQTIGHHLPFLLEDQSFKGHVDEEFKVLVQHVLKELQTRKTAGLSEQAFCALVTDILYTLLPQYPVEVLHVSVRSNGQVEVTVLQSPHSKDSMVVRVNLMPEEAMLVHAVSQHVKPKPPSKILGLVLYLAEQSGVPADATGSVFKGWNEEEKRQSMSLEHLRGRQKKGFEEQYSRSTSIRKP